LYFWSPTLRKFFMRPVKAILASVLILFGCGIAEAMQFRIEWIGEDKINVIVGSGTIEQGDVERLEKAIPHADRDRYGNIPIYLDSLGGSVGVAFAMVELMDREEFSALVGSGSRCASACASVLYLSARYHLIIGTGLIGLHGCYSVNDASGALENSSFCNEAISQNAVRHGTSYGMLHGWQTDTAPDQIVWIGREAACTYGFCGPPGFDEVLAVPSFNCAASRRPSEVAICSNKRLARHEASISRYYSLVLSWLPQEEKQSFRDQQKAWLKYRDSCQGAGIEPCLLQRMKVRSNEIMSVWATLAVKGGHTKGISERRILNAR